MSAPHIVSPATPADKLGNEEFLRAVFGQHWREAHVTGFPDDPAGPPPASVWTGGPWDTLCGSDHGAWLADMNSYFAISLCTQGLRRTENFRACHAIVLDDLGTKVRSRDVLRALGHPSWRLETSQGNEQWGYLLATPVTDVGRVNALLDQLNVAGLTDPQANAAVAYRRLPVGVNTKAGLDRRHVLREWEPTRRFELENLFSQAGGVAGSLPATGGPAGTGPGTRTGTSGHKWLSQADRNSGGVIIEQLDAWGELAGTRTGDGGWHLVACPWDHEHTPGRAPDDRTAVYPGGGFKCFHGHCANRSRDDFMGWWNKRLEEESGGLFCDVAQLDFDPVVSTAPGGAGGPRAKPFDPGLAARTFMNEMIFIGVEGRWLSTRTLELFSGEAINLRYREPLAAVLQAPGPNGKMREITVTDWWSRNKRRRDADGMVFWPGGGAIVTHNNGRYANRWRECVLGRELASRGPPIETWMVKPWLDLVKHVLGNEGGRFVVRVLDWMALIVAEPGLKPGWHVVVHGAQGIGKDLLMLPVVFAVGMDNVRTVSARGLHGDFNPYAEKRLVLVNELKQTSAGTATGRDQYTMLKTMTENTSPTVSVNQKNLREYQARNVAAFYVTSNEPDALALDDDDRRFVVAGSTAVKLPGDAYARLVAWLGGPDGHGTETVAAWLRQRWARLSAARRDALSGNAFSSASKREMILDADPVRAWMHEQIEDGTWPDLMTGRDIDERFQQAVRVRALRWAPKAASWGRLLRGLGGGKVYGGEPVRLPGGARKRVWAVREPERFVRMGEPQIAMAYRSAAAHAFQPNADVVDFPETPHSVPD
jgi:Family of unknown function (DUF5906)